MRNEEQLLSDYRRDGVVCLRSFLSPAKVQEIRDEIDRYVRDDLPTRPEDACTREADGQTVRNLWRLERYDDYFRQMAQDETLLEVVALLLGGEPVLLGVETFSKPARVGSGVPWHQDNAYFCQSPPDVLTLWIAIDAVTAENGPVRFIQGSHQLGMLPTVMSGVRGNSIGLAEPPSTEMGKEVPAILAPGDATIHHCQTVHASSPNNTDSSRLALLFVYRAATTETDPTLKSTYAEAVAVTPPA
ncbi:phytanoyl-CoA dioxygenase family protein [Blastopirellula sp. JC732]|uniref:Phytanoyl-CoA dioxygenase family protein n=1 Tax=Blastopirellula sediminis TaxID=2894196 RepID=A0A9X1MRN1_9BACT|nr:phytanoyl-CoA dioxygenase family protein [Blastopirellula sediminis]MCC9605530.1 phytanoyl-CoA dioxygenase family protein [Blastopirellula sediminis]MCC9631170.1 phytanoyl-CoA dioxygenase family protein [Blastopirellula sediminis]